MPTPVKKVNNKNCCVPQCTARGSKNPELSFHVFPSEKETVFINGAHVNRRLLWIIKLRIGNVVTRHMLVCSRHFLKTDYFLSGYAVQKPRLKRNAVPSVNLPKTPEEDSEEEEKQNATLEQRQNEKVTIVRVKRAECDDEDSAAVSSADESAIEAAEAMLTL